VVGADPTRKMTSPSNPASPATVRSAGNDSKQPGMTTSAKSASGAVDLTPDQIAPSTRPTAGPTHLFARPHANSPTDHPNGSHPPTSTTEDGSMISPTRGAFSSLGALDTVEGAVTAPEVGDEVLDRVALAGGGADDVRRFVEVAFRMNALAEKRED